MATLRAHLADRIPRYVVERPCRYCGTTEARRFLDVKHGVLIPLCAECASKAKGRTDHARHAALVRWHPERFA